MQCGAATAAAAAAASSYSTTAAAASAYPPNSAPPGETSQWTGNGLSQHVDTLDTTQWMDVRLQLLTQVIRQQTADVGAFAGCVVWLSLLVIVSPLCVAVSCVVVLCTFNHYL